MPGLVGRALSLATVLILLLALSACGPTDPATQVAEARAGYTVQLSGWIARPPATPEADTMEAAADAVAVAAAEEVAAEEANEGEEGEMVDEEAMGPDPRQIGILFDLLINFSGREPLAGITVDISHAGGDGNEKAVRQHYVELGGSLRGSTKQVDFELDGWDYEDGDQFAVEVRPNVPEAERANYREFNEAG